MLHFQWKSISSRHFFYYENLCNYAPHLSNPKPIRMSLVIIHSAFFQHLFSQLTSPAMIRFLLWRIGGPKHWCAWRVDALKMHTPKLLISRIHLSLSLLANLHVIRAYFAINIHIYASIRILWKYIFITVLIHNTVFNHHHFVLKLLSIKICQSEWCPYTFLFLLSICGWYDFFSGKLFWWTGIYIKGAVMLDRIKKM